MENILVKYDGDLSTTSTHLKTDSQVVTDAPTDNNGLGRTFSPTDLTCSSLASCMLTLMGITAQKHDFFLGHPFAKVTKTMGSNPRRIIKIKIELEFGDKYTLKQQKLLTTAALNCPVAKSLHPEINQEVSFNW